MKQTKFLLLLLITMAQIATAQIGIGTTTPDASALLDLSSTTKGLLLPRMSSVNQAAISNPAIGLTLFNTTTGQIETNKGDGNGGSLWTAATGGGSGSGTGAAYSNVSALAKVTTVINSLVVIPNMTISPAAGIYSVNFNGQYNINPGVSSSYINTTIAKSDLLAAYNQLKALNPTNTTHGLGFGTTFPGETIKPGIYSIAGAATINGTLNLDAQGDPNATFIIKIDKELAITQDSKIVLLNGAEAWNVFWVTGCLAGGAIAIDQNNIVKGTFLSNGAAVSLATGSVLEGRMLTTSGAVTIVNSVITIPENTSSINLGVISTFAMFSSEGAVGNTGGSNITGHVGSHVGAVTVENTATTLNGIVFTPTTADVPIDNSLVATFSIYQNNTLIANSVRTVISKLTKTDVIAVQGIATVAAGQAIDIRWKTNLGTVSMTNRDLTLIKLQ